MAGGALLEGMRDPTGEPTGGDDGERGAALKGERGGERREPDVERRFFACDEVHRVHHRDEHPHAAGPAGEPLGHLEQPEAPRIAVRIERMPEAGHRLAPIRGGDGYSYPIRWRLTAVDRNGVPRWVEATPAGKVSMDLKPAGFGGHWTVSRPTATSAGRTGAAVVELDEQFRPVRSFETVGLADTDNHDSIVRADGSRILVGYEPNAATDRVDSTI